MASTGSNSSSAFVLLRLLVLALALSPATAFMPPAATPAPGNGANAPGQQPPQTPRSGMSGEAIFNTIGCVQCHVRDFVTPDDPALEEALRGVAPVRNHE